MLTDLLPCPFCGGKAYMVQHGTPRQSCIIECGNCGTRHDSGDEGARCGSSWNRRAAHSVGAQTGSGSLAFDYGNALVDRKLDPSYNAWAQEPVAWLHHQGGFTDASFRQLDEHERARGWTQEPLYAQPHPQPMTDAARDARRWREKIIQAMRAPSRGDFTVALNVVLREMTAAIERLDRAKGE